MAYLNSLFALTIILVVSRLLLTNASVITGQSTLEKCDYYGDDLDCFEKLVVTVVIDMPGSEEPSNATTPEEPPRSLAASDSFTLVIYNYTDDYNNTFPLDEPYTITLSSSPLTFYHTGEYLYSVPYGYEEYNGEIKEKDCESWLNGEVNDLFSNC